MKIEYNGQKIECSAEEYKQIFIEKRAYTKKGFQLPTLIKETIRQRDERNNFTAVPKRHYKKRYHKKHFYSDDEKKVIIANAKQFGIYQGSKISAKALDIKEKLIYAFCYWLKRQNKI